MLLLLLLFLVPKSQVDSLTFFENSRDPLSVSDILWDFIGIDSQVLMRVKDYPEKDPGTPYLMLLHKSAWRTIMVLWIILIGDNLQFLPCPFLSFKKTGIKSPAKCAIIYADGEARHTRTVGLAFAKLGPQSAKKTPKKRFWKNLTWYSTL